MMDKKKKHLIRNILEEFIILKNFIKFYYNNVQIP